MAIYPYSFTLPPVNKQDIPSDGVVGEFLGISAGGVLDWLPVSGGSGTGDLLAANNLSELTPTAGTARTNLGLGTGDSPTFANLTLTSPSLASSAPVTISQTWNGTGSTVFKALVVNATTPGTTSSSSSLLLDLQVGGVSQFNVNKLGNISFPARYSTASIVAQTANMFAAIKSNYGGGGGAWMFGGQDAGSTVALAGDYIGFNGIRVIDTSTSDNIDTRLYRDGAANTLALRNGAAAQTFRVYNTYSDGGVNYERANFSFNSNRLEISTGQAGSGASRKIDFGTYGATGITFFTNTLNRWGINGFDGHFIAAADNTYDIGASGANRPRNVYVGTSIVSGSTIDAPYIRAGSAGGLQMQGRFFISSAADGNINLTNNAVTDFGRLQFGGTTDAFPAIARDGAGIKFTGAAAGATAWIKVPPVAVSALPLAATAGAGARAFVNDASSPTFGSAVTGGGAVLVPVYSDGSAWYVG